MKKSNYGGGGQKSKYNRMNFTFKENFVFLKQFLDRRYVFCFLTNLWLKVKFQPKSDHFGPNWHPCFDHFGGKKNNFLDFLKVVLGLFRRCLGIVFGLKMPLFGVFLAQKVDYDL